MWRSLTIFLACSLAVASQPAFAQDNSAAAERARLANQRIHAESERLARELERQQRLDTETQPQLADEAADNRSIVPVQAEARPPTDPQPEMPAEGMQTDAEHAAADLSQRLEQLRTLGELWDAGYVDDEEFERIKRRILGSEP